MSAEVLRRAASLMRERAEAAMAAPWEVLDSVHRDPYIVQKGRGVLTGGCIALASGEDYGKGNAAHIASWHPAVALAVADWLDSAASMGNCEGEPIYDAALAVARAYLFALVPVAAVLWLVALVLDAAT